MTMASQADKLVADYLKRLDGALRGLPSARRRELVDEISGHIAESRADMDGEDEAAVRTLLERTGEPDDIAADAEERFGIRRRSSGLDVAALILLLIGGVVVPILGWLVGVVLLWSSSVWTSREKLIGTLVVPGGLALPFFLTTYGTTSETCGQVNNGPITCTGGPSLAYQVLMVTLVIALVVVPIGTTIFLARRRGRVVAG
jgi:hypothetical protein